MILLNRDLPLDTQSIKGNSEVIFRPVQDLSCKRHGFAYTFSIPLPSIHSPSPAAGPTAGESSCLHLGNQ